MKVIVRGKAQGKILKTNTPINFLGAVDKMTGIIHDSKHDLFDIPMKNSILVFPNGVGSSVGAYTIYSIKSNHSAPFAMICKKVDLTVASGCALANIPLVIASEQEYDKLQNGMELTLDTDSGKL
ncbi:MAG: aconitase X swivel domain-containing protein [Candidatus Nitrosotenuis sp.]